MSFIVYTAMKCSFKVYTIPCSQAVKHCRLSGPNET